MSVKLGRFMMLVAGSALLVSGCATKKYVQGEVTSAETRVSDRMNEQVGELEGQIEANQARLSEHDKQIDGVSKTAQEALDRAIAAGKLAEGKLLYETVLSNDQVRFDFEKAELNEGAQAALDEFAGPLKSQDQSIYIEIQGHTDSSGEESYNLTLGEERAEAVRRYLNSKHGIPLHRMAVISYGESAPVADNGTREGRAQNRRVVLVVLK